MPKRQSSRRPSTGWTSGTWNPSARVSRGPPYARSSRRLVEGSRPAEAPPTRRPGLQLGRVVGVPVYLTPSWFVLAAFLVLALSPALIESQGTTQAYVVSVSFVVLLGVSVRLREIGHCLVARAFDLPVRSITITFLAGFTEITRPPQTPAPEYSPPPAPSLGSP